MSSRRLRTASLSECVRYGRRLPPIAGGAGALDHALGAAAAGPSTSVTLHPAFAVPAAAAPDNELVVALATILVLGGTLVPFHDTQGNTYHDLGRGEFWASNPTSPLATTDSFNLGATGPGAFANPIGITAASFKGTPEGAAAKAYGTRALVFNYGQATTITTSKPVAANDLVVVGYTGFTSAYPGVSQGPSFTLPAGWGRLSEARVFNSDTHYVTWGLAYYVPPSAGVVTFNTVMTPGMMTGVTPPDAVVLYVAAFGSPAGGLTFWM